MSKLPQVALEKLEELPEKRQDEIARAVLDVVDSEDDRYQLSDDQVAEIERRVRAKSPKTFTAKRVERQVLRRRA
jgi:hypothetical protein